MRVWSKADTHCVFCAFPVARDDEYERDHDDVVHDRLGAGCWCWSFCWADCDAGSDVEAVISDLRAQLEAES